MSALGSVLVSCWELLQTEFTIDGLTFSFWQIILWSMVAGAVVWMIIRWGSD